MEQNYRAKISLEPIYELSETMDIRSPPQKCVCLLSRGHTSSVPPWRVNAVFHPCDWLNGKKKTQLPFTAPRRYSGSPGGHAPRQMESESVSGRSAMSSTSAAHKGKSGHRRPGDYTEEKRESVTIGVQLQPFRP